MQLLIFPGVEAKIIPFVSGIYGYKTIVDGVERNALRIESPFEDDISNDEIAEIKNYLNEMLNAKYSTLRLFTGSFEYTGYTNAEGDYVNPDMDDAQVVENLINRIKIFKFNHIMKLNKDSKKEIAEYSLKYNFYSIGRGYTIKGPISIISKTMNPHSYFPDDIKKEINFKFLTFVLYQQTEDEWDETLKKYKNSDDPEEKEIYELITMEFLPNKYYRDISNLKRSNFYNINGVHIPEDEGGL